MLYQEMIALKFVGMLLFAETFFLDFWCATLTWLIRHVMACYGLELLMAWNGWWHGMADGICWPFIEGSCQSLVYRQLYRQRTFQIKALGIKKIMGKLCSCALQQFWSMHVHSLNFERWARQLIRAWLLFAQVGLWSVCFVGASKKVNVIVQALRKTCSI